MKSYSSFIHLDIKKILLKFLLWPCIPLHSEDKTNKKINKSDKYLWNHEDYILNGERQNNQGKYIGTGMIINFK